MFKFRSDDFMDIDRDRYPVRDVTMEDIGVKEGASPVSLYSF